MRKLAFRTCKNKGADQLHSNCAADQHLDFCYIASRIPLLPKYEISSLYQSSVTVQSVLDLVRNPVDRFSYIEADIIWGNPI